MKKVIGLCVLVLALGCGESLWAQTFAAEKMRHDLRVKKAPKEKPDERRATPLQPFSPRPYGIIYSMSERGFEMISPTAPPEFGYGQKFLTKFPDRRRISVQSGTNTDPEYGGLVFFGWEF